MRLLNLGAGGQRFGPPWINCDQLLSVLKEGTPERENLLKETNYVDCDLLKGLPFPDNYFDGIAAVHVIEHFTCHEAVKVLEECRRVLKQDGIIVVSVPDTDYFLEMLPNDTKENAVELFGEPIHDAGYERFFDYALFRHDHKQIFTRTTLKCLFLKAGFDDATLWKPEIFDKLDAVLNRRKFSLEMCAIKS